MALVKRLKNNSGAARVIMTRSVADQGYYELPYRLWVEALDDEDVIADVTSGELVVNDGISDLSVTAGLALLRKFQTFEGSSFADLTQYQSAESLSKSSTGSTSYQNKVTLCTSGLAAGDYRVSWSFEWRAQSNNKAVGYRVQVGNETAIMEVKPEHRNNWHHCGGAAKITISDDVNIKLDYKKIAKNAYIRNARLEIWRIS